MSPHPQHPPHRPTAPPHAGSFFPASGALRVLGHLQQAIAQDDRLMVLTGDDGVGKTTVTQHLLHGLDHRNAVWCVLLSALQLDPGELPGSLARAFGAAGAATSPAALRAELRRHLLLLGTGRSLLAVVDDAHALPPEAITELGEMLRELPLRVLLVGRPGLRMLLQRQLPLHPASLECHLEPLLESETAAYLALRLQRVAADGAPSFSEEAQALIHRFSRGIPLRIDRLCDRLLRAARQRGLQTVGAEEVQRIARPRLDEASIPMLTSAVDEAPSSGWNLATAPAEPAQAAPALPDWAFASQDRPKRRGAVAKRRRAGLVLSALALGAVLGLAAWRYFEPLPVDSTMTAAPARPPAPPPPAETPRAAAPAPAPVRPPALAPGSDGTPIAPAPTVPSPCTAAVVALGLCPTNDKPP
jgi:type II secretory pathway predicted ATPase ExeA